jgi:quaternary ammonium compound-resistance protein SugE
MINLATRTIPLGTAYAIWTGLGAAGTVIIGAYFFNEPLSLARIFFIATLVGSVIGLKVVS